ncbi:MULTISPECIES: cation:proton antiporter [Lactobacillales]|uniref:Monovalent cation:proton antiporter-2 (CPA2) family transporter n=1 Tax=Enterococcus devriesei TaxID=319970 RepID=A0A1L8SSV6_9ENTE|nr:MULTISPECIES: monovalent cation:proton antiporter-2 (CPA2) family protein [Enterococcus]MDU5512340.1 monovalent cation:proton antiporter-2 (CPA2) family protein [Enterococcus gilvus]OJG35013.1 monovalent cation:proton antiporter-2 (CPA2) family transporter [Enterococcus devriesei]
MEFIGVLCLILVSTTIAGHFSRRLGIPAVIGQLLVGILLGNAGLKIVHPDILVEDFSEIGVILLMFLAGLESDLSLLRKYFRPGMYVAVLGILFPVILGTLGGSFSHIALNESFYLGLILAATSVSISVEVLKELNVVNTKEGSTILGASVVDDILVVLIVSLSMSFLGASGDNNQTLGIMLVEQVFFFIGIYLFIRWGAPYLMRLSNKLLAESSVIIVSLILCLSMSYLANLIGLSSVIGSFFTGVAIGQTKVWKEVQYNIEAIGYAVFIPVFFVSIGLEVTFTGIGKQLILILFLTLLAIISKLFGGYFGGKLAGFNNHSSLMVGSGMISRGEMALIIVQLGVQAHLVSKEYYSAFILVILFTTLCSPFLLKHFTKKLY